MRIGLRNIMLGAAAVGLAIVGAGPALAGQAGSDTQIGSGSRISTFNATIGSGAAQIDINSTDTVYTPSSSINSLTVTLSLQISDDGYHGYSPSRNIATFTGSLSNAASIGVGTSSGIVSSQQTIGNANVSVHANTLLDSSVLSASALGSTGLGGVNAVMVLNPAFAISNSALAARVLAIEAMSGVITASGTGVTAIDLVGNNTFEMSPESNIATFTGNLSNTVTIGSATGITQSQQQIGNANVQTGFNTIVFSSGSATLPSFP